MLIVYCRLYGQLCDNDEIPTKATKSLDSQLQELRKVAAKRLILVVLDGVYCSLVTKLHRFISVFSFILLSDMWDAEHERPFSCIDPATPSKLLVVRRMRCKKSNSHFDDSP